MKKFQKNLIVTILVISMFVLSACVATDFVNEYQTLEENTNVSEADAKKSEDSISDELSAVDESENTDVKNEVTEDGENQKPEETVPAYTVADLVDFDPENAFSYCEQPVCLYSKDEEQLTFKISFTDKIPRSDNDKVYLFDVATFENEDLSDAVRPLSYEKKGKEVTWTFPFRGRYLFTRFVPAIMYEGKYIPLSYGQYISNPEILAENTSDYYEIDSKKGILVDANTVYTGKLQELDVKRVVYNIPLSYIMGESTDPDYPTIEYEYEGETYYFDGYLCTCFDSLFIYLTDLGYHITAIVLNDWNEDYPEIMHPKSRTQTGRSMFYAFNTEEAEGVRQMEAAAMFLAERYSGNKYGMVYDWVIANEINQQKIWNYMNTDDVHYYTESFEKSFRTFYNAIKANYSNAHVYFSLDHDWNDNWGNNRAFFNGRDILNDFNDIAKMRGNYDWGLSIHPYPNPLTRVKFWKGNHDKSEDAKVLTPMNLSVLTDLMKENDFLDTNQNVRKIAVTELGFSSKAGEKLQAAAFAYCYYILDNNEYIDSFLMNRETDDADSLKSGLALGIYNSDYSEKYITDVFKNIDSKKGDEYIPEMLEIIGAESLEEALSWAE